MNNKLKIQSIFAKLIFLIMTLNLTACVTSRIEDNRIGLTGISDGEGVVILAKSYHLGNDTETDFIKCVSSNVSRGSSPIRVIQTIDFKNTLFPWFEPRVEPTSAQELKGLFALTRFRERIEERNVKYIAWIEGDTVRLDDGGTMSCTLGPWGGGCLGFSYWEEDASYKATIWDLKELTVAGQISTDSRGTSYLAGVVVPIPILARPGNAACNALADQLKKFLQQAE